MLAENDAARVLELTLPPGAGDRFHGHPDGFWYVLSGSTVRLHDTDGGRRDVELATGRSGFQQPVEHRVENVGSTELRMLMVELRPVPAARGILDDEMERQCRAEIEELHGFFEDWFHARLDAEPAAFVRFDSVIADGFVFISPDGRLLDRTTLVEGVRGGHGQWRSDAAARIWIDDIRLHRIEGELATLTYHEWQQVGGQTRGRLSTVILRRRDDAPNGVEWLHVHEVWLPPAAKD